MSKLQILFWLWVFGAVQFVLVFPSLLAFEDWMDRLEYRTPQRRPIRIRQAIVIGLLLGPFCLVITAFTMIFLLVSLKVKAVSRWIIDGYWSIR